MPPSRHDDAGASTLMTVNPRSAPTLLVLLLALAASGWASLVGRATDRLAAQLGSAITNSNDPATVRDGLPAYLLLLGSFVVAARTLPGSAELHAALFGPAFPVWSQAVFLQNEMMAWYRQIGPWWLAVTWSVAIETHFYLFAPFLLRAWSRRTLLRAALAAMIGVLLLRVFAIQNLGGAHWASYATLARVDGLMLGVALAIGWRSDAFRDAVQRKIVFLRTLAAALFAAGMLVGFSEQLSNPLVSIALVPTIASLFWALVIVVTLQSGATLWGAGLRSRLLTGMGAISYFVYLFHLPVLYVAHAVFFDREPVHLSSAEMATTAGSFIAVVVLGAASWFTIERPAIRRGHQFRYDSA